MYLFSNKLHWLNCVIKCWGSKIIVTATVVCFSSSFIAAGLNRNWRNEISLVEEIEQVLKKQNKVDLKKKTLKELRGEWKDLKTMMFIHNHSRTFSVLVYHFQSTEKDWLLIYLCIRIKTRITPLNRWKKMDGWKDGWIDVCMEG